MTDGGMLRSMLSKVGRGGPAARLWIALLLARLWATLLLLLDDHCRLPLQLLLKTKFWQGCGYAV